MNAEAPIYSPPVPYGMMGPASGSALEYSGEHGFSRGAQGTASVAETVQTLSHQPWVATADVEQRIAQEQGFWYQGQPWTAEKHCEAACEGIEGRKQLEKRLAIPATSSSCTGIGSPIWPEQSRFKRTSQASSHSGTRGTGTCRGQFSEFDTQESL